MRIPITIQMYTGENGIAIISSMLGAYGKYVPLESLREKMVVSRNGSTPQQLADTAKQFGLSTEILNVSKEDLVHQSFPLIAFWKRRYYCIIKKIVGNTVYVMDPAKGNVKLPLDFFMDKYGGILIRMQPGEDFVRDGKKEHLFEMINRRLTDLRSVLVKIVILNILAVILNLIMINTQRMLRAHSPGFLKSSLPSRLSSSNSTVQGN